MYRNLVVVIILLSTIVL